MSRPVAKATLYITTSCRIINLVLKVQKTDYLKGSPFMFNFITVYKPAFCLYEKSCPEMATGC